MVFVRCDGSKSQGNRGGGGVELTAVEGKGTTVLGRKVAVGAKLFEATNRWGNSSIAGIKGCELRQKLAAGGSVADKGRKGSGKSRISPDGVHLV